MSVQTSPDLYLSPDQQDLLMAALGSNQNNTRNAEKGGVSRRSDSQSLSFTPGDQSAPDSGQLDYDDESPYLDFDPDADFDDSFGFNPDSRMIGDIPGELHDKRKSIDDQDEDDEGGGKRREGDDKSAKKPGRKPLTSEPTSKRKAQNRAAQRAFRERKERHLKDLETQVDDLRKASESASHENGLLRAQVERQQIELKEYRKRLSWVSANGGGRAAGSGAGAQGWMNPVNNHNDFQFEFPKFGDLPSLTATNLFNGSNAAKSPGNNNNNTRSATLPAQKTTQSQKQSTKSHSVSSAHPQRYERTNQSPRNNPLSTSPEPPAQSKQQQQIAKDDYLSGLFSPSILEATRHNSLAGYFPQNTFNQGNRNSLDNGTPGNVSGIFSNSSISNSDSPSSSSESHNAVSSIGTSPEPSLSSPGNRMNELGLNTINEENQIPGFSGFAATPGFDPNGINWLAQQNNNNFDPVLFGDYRETQDNILSQDFGSFFNDAYPLPDLGSPLHNYNDVVAPEVGAKNDLIKQVDHAKDGSEEVVPNTDKPMTCNKIWDRLQSMEKFRNGEIDIDNLCSELRAKAKCSEGGAVVDKKDVDRILGGPK